MISCQLAHLWYIWNYFFPTLILFATEILVAEYAQKTKKNLICSYHIFVIQYMVLFHSLNPGKINWVIWETSNRNRNKKFFAYKIFLCDKTVSKRQRHAIDTPTFWVPKTVFLVILSSFQLLLFFSIIKTFINVLFKLSSIITDYRPSFQFLSTINICHRSVFRTLQNIYDKLSNGCS